MGTTYALAVGGDINGPVIGGILTLVGFGAYGKHIRNVIPVLLGVFLVNLINIHDVNATFAILAALFGTTLAPIAGRYGVVAGVVAGALHMSLVTNIGFLHAVVRQQIRNSHQQGISIIHDRCCAWGDFF